MIELKKESDCCGCGACIDICPVKCIAFQERTLGHRFPVIDDKACINCGSCDRCCPVKNADSVKKSGYRKLYAAYSIDDEIRKSGSSGGLFFSFADRFMNEGYVVYGASFDENLRLRHTFADKSESLFKLCKSKYLQSDMTDVFAEIKKRIADNEKVFFCGTPCQVAALKRFIKGDQKNLFSVDFFCHGVPSQRYFDRCKELYERKNNCRVLDYSFRTKKHNGVTPHYFTIKYEKKGKIIEKTDFYYTSFNYAAFQSYINLRESCYECRFATEERCSDITIADFHEIDKYVDGIDRFQGVSTLIVNTDKGLNALEKVKDGLFLTEVSFELLKENKDIFSGATPRPKNRDIFIKDYESESFNKLNEKWFPRKKYLKQRIYYHLPKSFRKLAKKFFKE